MTEILVIIWRDSPPKNFYRSNLIFWLAMGYGIACFGRRDLKKTLTKNGSAVGHECQRRDLKWPFEVPPAPIQGPIMCHSRSLQNYCGTISLTEILISWWENTYEQVRKILMISWQKHRWSSCRNTDCLVREILMTRWEKYWWSAGSWHSCKLSASVLAAAASFLFMKYSTAG